MLTITLLLNGYHDKCRPTDCFSLEMTKKLLRLVHCQDYNVDWIITVVSVVYTNLNSVV